MAENDSLDRLVRLGPLAAAVVALLIALVIEPLKKWVTKPRIRIRFDQAEPYCHASMVSIMMAEDGSEFRPIKPFSAYHVRAWVENTRRFGVLGGTVAKGCKGKLTSVRDASKNRRFEYDPMSLHWVSEGMTGPNRYGPIDLAFGEGDYLDIIRTFEGQSNVRIATGPEPKGSPHDLPAGAHYLTVTIYGANFEPESFHLRVKWGGKKWDELQVHKVHLT